MGNQIEMILGHWSYATSAQVMRNDAELKEFAI